MDPNANLAEQDGILERQRTLRVIQSGKLAGYTQHTRGYYVTADWSDVLDVRGDRGRLRELREALAEWLSGPHPGFEPDWSKAPNARQYYGK